MPKAFAIYFLGLTVIAAFTSWAAHHLRSRIAHPPVALHDQTIPAEMHPHLSIVLANLERLLAEFTDVARRSNETEPLTDLGTRLETIFGDSSTNALSQDWQWLEYTLEQSFPQRDIEPALQVLRCFRIYRKHVENSPANPHIDIRQDYLIRYQLRIAYFGRKLADILFATEHQMLRESGSPISATESQTSAGDGCFNSGAG